MRVANWQLTSFFEYLLQSVPVHKENMQLTSAIRSKQS